MNNPQLKGSGFLSVGLIAIVIALLLPLPEEERAVAAISAMVGMVALVTVAWRYGTTRNPLDPLTLYSAAFVFYFVVHAVWALFHQVDVSLEVPVPWVAGMVRGQIYAGLGFIALLAGFIATPAKPLRHNRVELGHPSLMHLAGLYGFGLASNLVVASLGGFSKATADQFASTPGIFIFRTLGWLSLVAIVLLVCRLKNTDGGDRERTLLVIGLAFVAQSVLGLAFGAKQEFAFLIFAVFAAYNYTFRRLPIRPIALAALVFVFVITPVLQAGRTTETAALTFGRSLGSGQSNLASLGDHIKVLAHPDQMLNGFSIVQRRTNGAESLALAVSYTPHPNAYGYGSAWAAIPLTFVPRFIWPNKPTPKVTRDFSINYAGESPNRGYGLLYAPTQLGDFYTNFGLVGLLLGMALIGYFLKRITDLPKSPTGIALYVLLMVPFVLIEQDVGSSARYAIFRGLVALAAISILRVLAEAAARGS